VPGSREHDVIAGSAGALLSLLSLHHIAPDPALLTGMRAVGERLAAGAEEHGGGLAWRGAFHPERPLAGFSHGASGIATALARLDVRAGTRDYRDVVDGALRFERTLYDEGLGPWRDMRVDTPDDNNMVAWCHGAAGVSLARAELLAYAGDHDGVRHDLALALAAVANPATGLHNHSICHGDLGNAEILLKAANAVGDAELAGRAALIAADVARDAQEGAWRCGVPRGVETPGLMSGLAGIGLALLRCADPTVPSVLALDPPAYHRGAIGLP
ncbi:MAG TPA: lanthionine synthetase LanC family protein, partial [Phytomonospora sp.]